MNPLAPARSNTEVRVLVIGSGLAGLNAAQRLATRGRVLLVTKRQLKDAATSYAQGGIAAGHSADEVAYHHLINGGSGVGHDLQAGHEEALS